MMYSGFSNVFHIFIAAGKQQFPLGYKHFHKFNIISELYEIEKKYSITEMNSE